MDTNTEAYQAEKLKASIAVGVKPGMLSHFHLADPFNPENVVEGFICLKDDHRYGQLYILTVNGERVVQKIFGMPKIGYPFTWTQEGERKYNWGPISEFRYYEKYDGTNILLYQYRDANGEYFTTYKTRIQPFLKASRWGDFYSLWKRILEKYPNIPKLADVIVGPRGREAEKWSVAFEMFGNQNQHLVQYDVDLDTRALLFVNSQDGSILPAETRETLDVPIAPLVDTLRDRSRATEKYNEWRESLLEKNVAAGEDIIINEGLVVYCRTGNSYYYVPYKIKPEDIEEIHWKQGLNKKHIFMTILKVIEADMDLTRENVESILLQDFTQDEIEKPEHREALINLLLEKRRELEFQANVLEIYNGLGMKLSDDKGAVMREMSKHFERSQMSQVYGAIARKEGP